MQSYLLKDKSFYQFTDFSRGISEFFKAAETATRGAL